MEFLVAMNPFMKALLHSTNRLSTVFQLLGNLLFGILSFMQFLCDLIILMLKFTDFFFVFFAIFFQQLDSSLQIFIFSLKKVNELARFINCLLHHLPLSFLFLHRYYNTLQSMSFELANRIEQLTNKLTQQHKNHGRDERIQEAKEQLIALQQSLSREFALVQNRMRRIEDKLQHRADKANRQSQSVDEIWGLKQERVSEVIGGWISEYQQKLQHAKEDLNREQLIYKKKLEQQQQMYNNEARMMQDKIKTQLKTLEKELSKWETINSQNHSAVIKQLSSYKQMMIRQVQSTHQTQQDELKSIDARLNNLKQSTRQRLAQLRAQIDGKSLRTKQIFELLLSIE